MSGIGIRQVGVTVVLGVIRFPLVPVFLYFLLGNCSGDNCCVEGSAIFLVRVVLRHNHNSVILLLLLIYNVYLFLSVRSNSKVFVLELS